MFFRSAPLALVLLRAVVGVVAESAAIEDLIVRQLGPASALGTTTSSSHGPFETVFTATSSGSTISGATITPTSTNSSTSTTSSTVPLTTLTGFYTALAGGSFPVTEVNGTAYIAGHTLAPGGGDAFVGGVEVTQASGGIVLAGGTMVSLKTVATSTSQTTAATMGSTATTAGTTTSSSKTSSSSGLGVAATGRPAVMVGAAAAMGMMVGCLAL